MMNLRDMASRLAWMKDIAIPILREKYPYTNVILGDGVDESLDTAVCLMDAKAEECEVNHREQK